MNENQVQKTSLKVFLIGLIIMLIIGCYYKCVAYPLGFILGYGINHIAFYLIIKMSDAIIQSQQSILIVMISYIAKLIVYAIGFYLAVTFPNLFNLFTVFIGYFVIQTTIKLSRLLKRRED